MKASHLYLPCGIAATLIFLAATTRVDRVDAQACPGGASYAIWNPSSGSQWPDEVDAEGEDSHFSATERFSWCMQNTPNYGGCEFVGDIFDNIVDPAYDPEYFFPNSQVGSVDVVWSGRLDDEGADGTMETRGWVNFLGPPPVLEEDEKTLTVHHQ